jgi:DNA-binding MarR family transcriptional regulator
LLCTALGLTGTKCPSTLGTRDLYTRDILDHIERREGVTQRQLAGDLEIALGLTNLLIKRVVSKGWVKVVNVKPNRFSYLITPAGLREKARITRAYFNNTVRLYTETRERLRESLNELSENWDQGDTEAAAAGKRIVFYGAGEVAEIGFISLQGSDLELVGVVDDRNGGGRFFNYPVHDSSALKPTELAGEPFGRLVVMSFRKAGQIRAQLDALKFPQDRVFWL